MINMVIYFLLIRYAFIPLMMSSMYQIQSSVRVDSFQSSVMLRLFLKVLKFPN